MPLAKFVKCPQCHGFGKTPDGKTCRKCKGRGEIEVPSHPRSDFRAPQQKRPPHGVNPA